MSHCKGRECVRVGGGGVEGRRKRAGIVDGGLAELGLWRIVCTVRQDIVVLEEGGILVVSRTEVDNLAKGIIWICPRRVVRGRVRTFCSLARHISVDCDVELMVRAIMDEACIEVERYELKLQRVRVDDVRVQAIVKVDKGSADKRRNAEEVKECRPYIAWPSKKECRDFQHRRPEKVTAGGRGARGMSM